MTGLPPTARWAPGEDIVIAWPGGVALVDATVGLRSAERIWTRLHRDSRLGTFLKALAESSDTGFLDLPTFAVAIYAVDRCHIAVRGHVLVVAQVAGAAESVSGEGVTTWAERVLPLPEAVRLGDLLDPETSGPVVDAVLPGSGVERGVFRTEVAAMPEATGLGPSRPESQVGAVPPQPTVPEPVAAGQPAREVDPDRTRTGYTAVQDLPGDLPDEELDLSEDPAPNPYASLWDPSVAIDIEAAAIRPEEESGARAPVTGVTEMQSSGDTLADEGVVQVVTSATNLGTTVLARFCDRGHPNPPERDTCFVCGAMVSGEARMAERPQLGYLRVGGGERVPLKGPIIAGRNPKSMALKLTETPRLMALPHAHVSATHLAFLLEGWRVMVRDLNSRNGTYLRRHDAPPVRLPDIAIPLMPRDLIDLGKGLFIYLEGTP